MANDKTKKTEKKDKTIIFDMEDYQRLFRFKMDLEYKKGDTVKWSEAVVALLDEYEKHNPKK